MNTVVNISVVKLIAWFAVVVAAVAGGTFAVTRFSAEQHVAALEAQLKSQQNPSQSLSSSDARPLSPSMPTPTLSASTDQEEAKTLLKKIQDLESEKSLLVSRLSLQSQDALDPKSEVASLASQLRDSLKEKRIKAIEGLFAVKDSATLPIILSYFRRDPKEATSSIQTPLWQWFNLIWSIDQYEEMKFSIEVLRSSDDYSSRSAYDDLYNLTKEAHVNFVVPRLKEVALSNGDVMVRTRAKLLLQHFQMRKQAGYQPEDNRSLSQMLLDIEKEIKKIRPKK